MNTIPPAGSQVKRLQKSLREGEPGGTSGDASRIASLDPTEQSTVRLFQTVAPSVAFITGTVLRQGSPLALRAVEVPAGSGSGFVWDESQRSPTGVI